MGCELMWNTLRPLINIRKPNGDYWYAAWCEKHGRVLTLGKKEDNWKCPSCQPIAALDPDWLMQGTRNRLSPDKFISVLFARCGHVWLTTEGSAMAQPRSLYGRGCPSCLWLAKELYPALTVGAVQPLCYEDLQ